MLGYPEVLRTCRFRFLGTAGMTKFALTGLCDVFLPLPHFACFLAYFPPVHYQIGTKEGLF